MAIKFTIAKRGLLPHENSSEQVPDKLQSRSLRPILQHGPTIDATEFQASEFRLPSLTTEADLVVALGTLKDVMLHELKKGHSVSFPGIGSFRLSLKGDIEIKNSHYCGKNVHVDNLVFRPDRELLHEVCSFEVDQEPFGQIVDLNDAEVESRLTKLFVSKESVSHKDITFAFERTLSRNRITKLLRRLVSEGRIIRQGKGAKTRYLAAPGEFGK